MAAWEHWKCLGIGSGNDIDDERNLRLGEYGKSQGIQRPGKDIDNLMDDDGLVYLGKSNGLGYV